jgi:tRNA G18 (ribose-2'-O)-methylase SpoU
VIPIDDAGDPRLDDYRNVPDPELVRRGGMFVAEGRLVVRRLLTESPFVTRSLLVTEPVRASLADVINARPQLAVYVVPQAVMSDITGFNIHRGCLALGERPRPVPWQDIVTRAPQLPTKSQIPDPKTQIPEPKAQSPQIVIVLERIANADNVGGVFRNAAAFGAGAVLVDSASADPLYRKAIRTSMGAALLVPFARAEPWPGVVHDLRERGFAVIAMTPAPPAATLRETVEGIGGRPAAIVLGHEGEGLTRAALDACEYRARIPMAAGVDSLNVAAVSAVALYEMRRAG